MENTLSCRVSKLVVLAFVAVSISSLGAHSADKPAKPEPSVAPQKQVKSKPVENFEEFESSLPAPTEVVKGKPLVQTIKLQEYLTRIEPEEVVEKMDSTGKNDTHDIFIIYRKSEDGIPKKLVRQLFDLNRDKKIDLVKHFEKGKMIRTEMDLDYDTLVDVVTDYDEKTGEIKKKIQADGNTNVWKYYSKTDLRKKEVDRNSDGKPDMWVYYRNNKVIRTEIDQNFAGKIVRIEGPLDPTKGKKAASGAKGTGAD